MERKTVRPVVGYIRVSSEEQAKEGISLDAQLAKVQDYCRLHDLDLSEILRDDGISAKNLRNRPGATELVRRVKCREVSGVVIYKLDRLVRNTREALDIAELCQKNGVAWHSISEKIDTSSAMGEFFFTLMAALAQLERKLISERTKAALQHKRRIGEHTGGAVARYGYTLVDGGKLYPNVAEQQVLRQIRQLRLEQQSYNAVARWLNANGIKSKTGGQWHASAVRSVVMSSKGQEVSHA